MESADKTGYVLGGELLVTGNGVYTFAYTYRAPSDDVQVLLVGMNHWGDEAFWLSLIKDDGALKRYSGTLVLAAKRIAPELINSFNAFLKIKSRLTSVKNLRRAYGEYLLLTGDTPDLYAPLTVDYRREALAVENLEREPFQKKPANTALKIGAAHISRI